MADFFILHQTYSIIGAILLFFLGAVYITKRILYRTKTIETLKNEIRTMNENVNKFLVAHKDKDSSVDTIPEWSLKKEEKGERYPEDTEIWRDEKIRTLMILQQRLQEVEHKYRRVLLLHKSITEKENIKDALIEEKERNISNLQHRIYETEKKLNATSNERNKDRSWEKTGMERRGGEEEEQKNQIFIILAILLLLLIYLYFVS